MSELKQLEYLLLGYVPNVLRPGAIDIALCLHDLAGGEEGFAAVRFISDWARIAEIDPGADLEMLQALENDIRSQWHDAEMRQLLIRRIEDSFSNTIQLSKRKVFLSEDPFEAADLLERDYLKSIRYEPNRDEPRVRTVPESGAGYIRSRMRSVFETAGVLPLMLTDIPTANTAKGDRLKFDFGYNVGSDLKLIHAVSMHSRLDAAVSLAARYPKIARDYADRRGVKTWLTAVVEDDVQRGEDDVKFALDMMEENGIEIGMLKDTPTIADRIRKELRA